jgi:hypothetical protein
MNRDNAVSKLHNLEFNYDGSANLSGEQFLSSPSRALKLRCPLFLKSYRYHKFFLQKLLNLEFHRGSFPVHKYIFLYVLLSVPSASTFIHTHEHDFSLHTSLSLRSWRKRLYVFSLLTVHVPLVTTLLGPIKCIFYPWHSWVLETEYLEEVVRPVFSLPVSQTVRP